MKTDKLQFIRNIGGVYFLYNLDELVYIGYSKNIYIRILEHFYNNKGFDSFSYYELKNYSANEMKLVENVLIAHYSTELNKHIIKDTLWFYESNINSFTESYKYYEEEANFIICFFKHTITKVVNRTIVERVKDGLSSNSFYLIQKFMKSDKDIVKQISEYFYKDRLIKNIKGIL